MSGRDLRAFLVGHRAGTFNLSKDRGLSAKYLAGGVAFGGRGLRNVDYSQLLSKAREHRATADSQKKKIKSLRQVGADSKDSKWLRLHQEVWQHQWAWLASEGARLEGELEEWRANALTHATGEEDTPSAVPGVREGMSEITEYMADLYLERRRFEEKTVTVLRTLGATVRRWVGGNVGAERWEEAEDLQERFASAKQDYSDIQSVLQDEHFSLWRDLRAFKSSLGSAEDTETRMAARGVPTGIAAMECANPDLKSSLMEEFHHLRGRYQLAIQRLRERHKEALSCEAGIEWAAEDEERFAQVVEQYPTSLRKRRAAYLDRLAREFPHHTRQQLVAHETCYLSWSHFRRQKESYLRDWQTQYRGLEVRVQRALEDYAEAVVMKEAGQVTMETQATLCRCLHEKVLKWREEKEQFLAAQVAQEATLQEQQQLKRDKEEEKRKKKQERTKVQLSTFHREKEERQAEEEAWLESLRAETEVLKRERALLDQGRVKYRKKQAVNKISLQKKALAERAEEEREREKRLTALRQQVKVHVTCDPERVHQQTLSMQARLSSDPDLPIQHPLFTIHGFSANKVTSDPRLRLEEALRKVGLHNSEYARHVMSSIQPPTVPRPDQKSSLFKGF